MNLRAIDTSSSDRLDLLPVGQCPAYDHVPERMHAWTIRRDRHGPPSEAMRLEVVPTWTIGDDEVLVYVMAAGINYNGVWAALGSPISPSDIHGHAYHIAGSDAAGIVWRVGKNVRRWNIGDEVVVHCNQDDGDDADCNGGDPMLSKSQRIWGYETADGSFSQFCRVQSRQLLARPKNLGWAQSAGYLLTLATSYRMLFGHPPHLAGPNDHVLVWGAAGGLGVFAVQLARLVGASVTGIVSQDSKAALVERLGATSVINRKAYDCWGPMPTIGTPQHEVWMREVKRFGQSVRVGAGGRDASLIFEHPGRATFAVSSIVAGRGAMIVFCAATTGYDLGIDARHVWMRQKRIQGSHFATLSQASKANDLVIDGRVDPCVSEILPWTDLANAHQRMVDDDDRVGNMVVLVGATPHSA